MRAVLVLVALTHLAYAEAPAPVPAYEPYRAHPTLVSLQIKNGQIVAIVRGWWNRDRQLFLDNWDDYERPYVPATSVAERFFGEDDGFEAHFDLAAFPPDGKTHLFGVHYSRYEVIDYGPLQLPPGPPPPELSPPSVPSRQAVFVMGGALALLVLLVLRTTGRR